MNREYEQEHFKTIDIDSLRIKADTGPQDEKDFPIARPYGTNLFLKSDGSIRFTPPPQGSYNDLHKNREALL